MNRNMFPVIIPLLAAAGLGTVARAATPGQVFWVCGSDAKLPSVYFSGVLEGPLLALQGFRDGFAAFLLQRVNYKGAVGCLPANSALNAQNFINSQSALLRNAKKTVIDTGWSEPAPVSGATAPAAAPNVKAQGPSVQAGGASAAGNTGGAATGSQWATILGNIFNSGGAAGSSSAKTGAAGKSGSGSDPVSNTLSNVFGNSSNGSASGASHGSPPGLPDGALGAAQSQTTRLVVYGCGRQDAQVACVTELTNQNSKETLVQAGDIWKDTFIVDDRGDRHARSAGFFLNVDGDQRAQIDISYGKTARFVLMFDGVPSKVQKVALRAPGAGLDVEDIGLVAAGSGAPAGH